MEKLFFQMLNVLDLYQKVKSRYCMLCSYSIQYINFFFAIFLKEEKILFHHNSTPLIITLLCS